MTMLDLTNEDNQKEFTNGPVPSGSVVMVEVEVLKAHETHQDIDNPFIFVSKTGLKQISCQFVVSHGQYQGVRFRQNITLPFGLQNIQLTEGQRKSCNIGGATLKAMCIAAKKSLKMHNVTDLTGLKFPVKVKINSHPTEKDGRVFWNNELAFVVTPDKADYATVVHGGEIIIDGPVTGTGEPQQAQTHSNPPEAETYGQPFPSEDETLPF